ncbi:MAG: ATP-binding protein [Candidatus Omnitrophica bacterium]|nr:ATP-binding protein [Candidatus Omnitrophota bacterium]
MSSLQNTYLRLINQTNYEKHRYLYDKFDLSNKLTGIVGARGTGKTTLMLQYIKEQIKDLKSVLYVSVDHIYFNNVRLFDFVQEAYETENISIFFLDEIHKYKNWNQELKNIYDAFPSIKVVFSGSSSIDLIKGTYDLTRRGVIHKLKGLSFREYLNFTTKKNISPFTYDELMKNYQDISFELSKISKIKGHFNDYLKYGYYPYIFEGNEFFNQKLMNTVNKTIYEDISNFFKLKTENLNFFFKILYFLATIPPGNINTHNLSNNLGIDDKTTRNYVNILNETGLVTLIFSNKKGGSLIRKPEKIFIDNTSLYYTLCEEIGKEINVGTVRELFFINALNNSGRKVFYRKKAGDFNCGNVDYEIGGKNKTKQQIKTNLKNSFIVKDDVLISSKNVIPLYLFGFLY